jgi:hypothetical protein
LDKAAEVLEHPAGQGTEGFTPGAGPREDRARIYRAIQLGYFRRILVRPFFHERRRHLEVELERIRDPPKPEAEGLILAGL